MKFFPGYKPAAVLVVLLLRVDRTGASAPGAPVLRRRPLDRSCKIRTDKHPYLREGCFKITYGREHRSVSFNDHYGSGSVADPPPTHSRQRIQQSATVWDDFRSGGKVIFQLTANNVTNTIVCRKDYFKQIRQAMQDTGIANPISVHSSNIQRVSADGTLLPNARTEWNLTFVKTGGRCSLRCKNAESVIKNGKHDALCGECGQKWEPSTYVAVFSANKLKNQEFHNLGTKTCTITRRDESNSDILLGPNNPNRIIITCNKKDTKYTMRYLVVAGLLKVRDFKHVGDFDSVFGRM